MLWVEMKSVDTKWKTHSESRFSSKIDAEEWKLWLGNRIRYPITLSVNDEWWPLDEKFSGVVNTLTIPPCEYGRKDWKQKN